MDGKYNIPRGTPGYSAKLDRDGDDLACPVKAKLTSGRLSREQQIAHLWSVRWSNSLLGRPSPLGRGHRLSAPHARLAWYPVCRLSRCQCCRVLVVLL
ncbi:excalibur calcium-binding domain-containing protein [Mycobacteroides abscessus]|uniref:excalibur calcium-binding domain-containing protein n=1 Tax=Mycobacteroides abscessus TaxID=36809 RepID=UPI001F1E047B|nr:excalibur calcium-binding domain-containing protein [Mycobacteroides abscessus]